MKILRLVWITLLPVVFGINHYYCCLVTTLPLSGESGWFFRPIKRAVFQIARISRTGGDRARCFELVRP